jgi:8-oxo-dGTP diphosphatase
MTESSFPSHGGEKQRYMLVGEVHLLLVNSTGEVLFGQRQETGYKDGVWHLPSDHLEAGESVVAALIREAREAIGVAIDEQDVMFAHVMHDSSGGGRVAFFFVVRNWAGEPENRDPGKCRQLAWFSLGALPYDVIPYCRTALEWIVINHYFSAYGW